MAEAGRFWLRPHPGWAWTVRYPRLVDTGSNLGLLLFGGVIGVLPPLVASGWTWDLGGFAVGMTVAAAVCLGGSVIARRGRDAMLKRNGLAYIVRELGRNWQDDKRDDFMVEAGRRFVRVVEVPGPGQLGQVLGEPSPSWDWPLDKGAQQWDDKLDELVRSFRSLYLALEASDTTNTLFIYAWWAVAMGFGARVSAANRALKLRVGQRPSDGRAGKVDPDLWVHLPQSFAEVDLGSSDILARPGAGEFRHSIELAVDGRRRGAAAARGGAGGVGGGGGGGSASVLLLRFGRQGWDPLPAVGEKGGGGPLPVYDRARIGLSGASGVVLHELRCVPLEGESRFGWEDYPALAVAAADWIERKAAELPGHSLLLGAIMPAEVAVGVGICAGRVKRTGWPEHLWPLMYQTGDKPYVVPRLDLGAARFSRQA